MNVLFFSIWMNQVTPEVFSVFGKRWKTNNSCESLHSRMGTSMPKHPTFFRFLESLVENVIEPTERDILQIDAGNNPRISMSNQKLEQLAKLAQNEVELSTGKWTATHFLEVSAHSLKKYKKPTAAELERIEIIEVDLLAEADFQERMDEEGEQQQQDEQAIPPPLPQHICTVCQDEPKNALFMPCKHFCMCQTCASILEIEAVPDCPLCPLCNVPVQYFITVELD